MNKLMRKMNDKKGFTLAELLIVVAIIAVLVAISIPVFTAQLEKSREATDAANIRAAYAEVMTAALTQATDVDGVTRSGSSAGAYKYTATVKAKQTVADWQSAAIEDIGGLAVGNTSGQIQAVTASGTWTIEYDESTAKCTITPVNS